MIRYLGAPAIANAIGVSPETVYRWSKAQRKGGSPPIQLRRTANGRIWCNAEDVDAFFSGPVLEEQIAKSVNDRLRRLGIA